MRHTLAEQIEAIEIDGVGKATLAGMVDFQSGDQVDIESQDSPRTGGLFHPDSKMFEVERNRTGRAPVETVFRAPRPEVNDELARQYGEGATGPCRYVTVNLPLLGEGLEDER